MFGNGALRRRGSSFDHPSLRLRACRLKHVRLTANPVTAGTRRSGTVSGQHNTRWGQYTNYRVLRGHTDEALDSL